MSKVTTIAVLALAMLGAMATNAFAAIEVRDATTDELCPPISTNGVEASGGCLVEMESNGWIRSHTRDFGIDSPGLDCNGSFDIRVDGAGAIAITDFSNDEMGDWECGFNQVCGNWDAEHDTLFTGQLGAPRSYGDGFRVLVDDFCYVYGYEWGWPADGTFQTPRPVYLGEMSANGTEITESKSVAIDWAPVVYLMMLKGDWMYPGPPPLAITEI